VTVLLTCGCCFAIGFQSGALLVATSLILTESFPALVEPHGRRSAARGKLFPSYQRYLMQKGVSQ